MSKIPILVALLWLSVISSLSAQGSFTTTSGASVRISGAAYLKLNNTQWDNDGTFTAGGSTLEFSGNQPAGALVSGFTPDVLKNLRINRSAGTTTLLKNIVVTGNLSFSAGLFNLNGFNVSLPQPGSTLAGENENSRVISSSTGEIQLIVNLNAPASVNPGNLGAVITSATNLGNTIVRRGHLPFIGACNGSIKRYFFIQPANNSGLNATLRLHYFDAELNGVPETELILYRSDNGGASWTAVGFDNRNTAQNWVEKSGLSSLSMYTLADANWLSVTTWYLDADNDSYYSGTGITQCTSPGTGYRYASLIAGGDCNDSNAAINPGADEIPCNDTDENCNGMADDDPMAPVISNCPVARIFVGCDLTAIAGPTYSATPTVSSYMEFSNPNNQGIASDNCTIESVMYRDEQTNTCPITVSRTWTLSDGTSSTLCVQAIQINAPAVSLNCPADVSEPACQTPAAIGTAFSNWLASFGFSGGCNAAGAFDGGTPSAPGACGGSVTATYRVRSTCAADAVCTKTFSVANAPAVVLNCPENTMISTCRTQTEVDNLFADWLAEASFSGGCNSALSNNAANAPAASGGSVTVEFRLTSSCLPDVICSRTFGVSSSSNITLTCPGNLIKTTSDDMSLGDCLYSGMLLHPTPINGCPPYTLTIGFSNGAPAPDMLPLGGTVSSGGNTAYSFNVGQTIVTYQAVDAYGGGTVQCVFVVTVTDDEAPSILCPAPVAVSCASNVPAVSLASVTATDFCGPVTKSHLGDVVSNMTCINRKTITRTYQAVDVSNRSATCTQVITVFDNTLPSFTFVPGSLTVQCHQIPAIGAPTATDNCGSTVVIVYNGQTVSGTTCTDQYTLTRKWTATDLCGNTRTATQVITVMDTQKPVFVSIPAGITVQCDAIPAPAVPSATDNCDATVAMTYNGQTQTGGACPNSYILTRRWTATDNCGNTRSESQRITVVDNIKPVFTSLPGDATIFCTDPLPQVGIPVAMDGCAGNVAIVYLGQSTANNQCPGTYQIRRIWRATDVCGNSTTALQTISVQDVAVPVFTSLPAPVTIQCNQPPPPIGTPTATDACGGYVYISYLGQVASGGGCMANFTIKRTWKATDLCGLTATATQVITVRAQNFSPPGEDRHAGTELKSQNPNLKTITLQPNPTTDRVLIDLSDFDGEAVTVSVFSDLGQLVWQLRIDAGQANTLPVNLREAGASPGMYTLSVRGANATATERVVLVE